ncbi:MAG: hypothetical protein K2N01_02970 [Lachnospiraceae bacterium]|nr:hypothetical protein [Lachnospiraceae bacterium]
MAEKTGIGRSTLYDYEIGKRCRRWTIWKRLRRYWALKSVICIWRINF